MTMDTMQSAKLKMQKGGRRAGLSFLVLLFAFCILPFELFAKGAGTSSGSFLKMGVGARGVAMGDAQTAATDDVLSLYWNPAGLGRLDQNEMGFMRNTFIQDTDQNVAAYGQPAGKLGTFGVGVSMLKVSDIEGYDAGGARLSSLEASDTLITLGWGKTWSNFFFFPDLNTGINLKSLQKKLGNDSASTLLADVGFLYEARRGLLRQLRTGIVLQNLGGGLNFISEKSDLPQAMKLGFAYPFFGESLVMAADIVSPSDNDVHYNFGMDYRLWDVLALRLGYKGQADLSNGLTYGVSFGNRRLHLDYAFVPFGDLGNTHRMSAGWRFGRSYQKAQVQVQISEAYKKAESRYGQGYLVDAFIQASQILDVAPWHRPSRQLMHKVQQEFKDMEDIARKEQLQIQIDDHFSRGEQHFQLDELLPAKREFEAILALNPGHQGAKTYLNRIQERFQSIVNTFYETAMRFFAAGDYRQAKENFEKVLVVNPNHVEAREQLARTEKLLKEAQKAASDRARMESIRPIYTDALDKFGKKDYKTALQRFEDVLQIDAENAEARRYRLLCRDLLAKQAFGEGNEAARVGDWFKSSDCFRRALQYKPNYPEAQAALDKVKANLGEQQKGESQKLYKQGLEAFLSGDQEKARDLWQRAVDLDPQNMEAKRGLERITSQKRNGQ